MESVLYCIVELFFVVFVIISIYNVAELHLHDSPDTTLRYVQRLAVASICILIGGLLTVKLWRGGNGEFLEFLWHCGPFLVVTGISDIILNVRLWQWINDEGRPSQGP